ncbi:MAG: FAD-dependent oxidoreductase [Hyphomicrobiales bacterium]|nr:MAG: FAD-dependent oxidoreductase [Hyphomicrobiales bacterium]
MPQVRPIHLETDVLVIGAGGAGMYAAIEAARGGAKVLLLDRALIGRGGATVMAMMTVAVALGQDGPDDPAFHLADTLAAGRGLCDERLSRLLCEEGPECILEMDRWGVGWARNGDHIKSAHAPGHDRPRCVYVDFLNTGPAVSKTLRTALHKHKTVRRLGDVLVVDLVRNGDAVTGAAGVDMSSGAPVTIAAGVTIIATGGLTRLYRRNSASANMGGDGYALGLRAGAKLIDMEFVQFFPIGHLAPRMIGLDPIMWDPFRYKLGGRLLNGQMEEFTHRYGTAESGRYVITRDLATYAITKEVEAGRGSPHGGAYLSFMHLSEAELKAAFGPVIDKIARNGIDLTKMPVEVAPIAHYHMGGISVDTRMETGVPGLLAAGEAVGGANGANRLSGNAITEALVFGRRAGRTAAEAIRAGASSVAFRASDADSALALISAVGAEAENPAALVAELQAIMWENVGPFRTQEKLAQGRERIAALAARVGSAPPGAPGAFDARRLDWFDLRNMLLVAETVVEAALLRKESRGAHQREDFPAMQDDWACNQTITLGAAGLDIARGPVLAAKEAAQ